MKIDITIRSLNEKQDFMRKKLSRYELMIKHKCFTILIWASESKYISSVNKTQDLQLVFSTSCLLPPF